jgi:hypothetical protein
MPSEPIEDRLGELLVLWEERREKGEDPTAEDLCAGSPELAAELARRIATLRAMEPLFDPREAADPPAPPAGGPPGADDGGPPFVV